ncbi:hypothetical protein [Ethanoligenens harbinense]|uniref:Uncharacterized protein n=1 Tax=Ethanoligenens harbinense (strain DSM 18485 / JCM 12961 / CGMCC 1.5033 / YUAN-3) TaxID=663278 RepID=E6UA22_ETHHY|nr:hypothetical protein [Ethanoligenens harbinense]ADU27383.1 hypothetical protein Ethha_1859 [Ethanoligenens harbinense YUAN-3]
MANKKSEKVPISRDCFLRIIHEKGYTVEELGEQPQIDRSGKTIQRSLSAGEMSPELLDRIGKFLNVDPTYLAGEYDRKFEEMKDSLPSPDLTHYLWTRTDRFPYSKHETENIDYKEYLLDTLLINNISKEQFFALEPQKKRSFQFDLGLALHNVIKQYFDVDSQGKNVEEFGMISEGLTMLMGDWIK